MDLLSEICEEAHLKIKMYILLKSPSVNASKQALLTISNFEEYSLFYLSVWARFHLSL